MKCVSFNNKKSGRCRGDTGESEDYRSAASKLKSAAVRTGSFGLICLPFAIFAGTVLGWYVEASGWAVPALSAGLFLLSVAFFLLSCFTNPGVIPRRSSRWLPYDLFRGRSSLPFSYNANSDEYGAASSHRDLHMSINGKPMKIKYCVTCNIFRSPRAVHCRICNVCVHRFDHHCKWLDNCIGYNNYRYFIAFVASTFLLIIAILALTLLRLAYVRSPPSLLSGRVGLRENRRFITEMVFISLLLIMVVSSGWFVVGLFVYHFHLIVTNQTTNEQLKGVFHAFNPHNRGFLANLRDILFRRHAINYGSNTAASMYNPVSKYDDIDNLSLIGSYLINSRNAVHSSSSSSINAKQADLYTIGSEIASVESNVLSDIKIVHSRATSVAHSARSSADFEDAGQSELSLGDVIDDYNALRADLSAARLFNEQVQGAIGADQGPSPALNPDLKQKSRIFTRKNGIDVAKSRLQCCKY